MMRRHRFNNPYLQSENDAYIPFEPSAGSTRKFIVAVIIGLALLGWMDHHGHIAVHTEKSVQRSLPPLDSSEAGPNLATVHKAPHIPVVHLPPLPPLSWQPKQEMAAAQDVARGAAEAKRAAAALATQMAEKVASAEAARVVFKPPTPPNFREFERTVHPPRLDPSLAQPVLGPLRRVTEGMPATSDVRGNLGPASVVTSEVVADWLKDR